MDTIHQASMLIKICGDAPRYFFDIYIMVAQIVELKLCRALYPQLSSDCSWSD